MTTNPRAFPAWLWLMGALTAIGPLSIDMYLPSFPAIAAELDASAGRMELTLASFFIGLALGQTVYGPLSDRFGRKRPLYIGLLLYAVASIACMSATSVEALTFWRFIQALGGCAGMVISRAIVRDRTDPQGAARMFSLLMMVIGLAPVLAPLLGSWVLTVLGWPAIFAFQALFALGTLVWMHVALRETHIATAASPLALREVLRDYAQLLGNRLFVGYAMTGGLVMAGMFAYIAGSPAVIIEQFGIDPVHYSWIFGANALGFIGLSQLNARLLDRHSMTRLLQRAVWLPALSSLLLLLLAAANQLPLALLLTGLFLYIASLGLILPNSSASALSLPNQKTGTASALLGTIQFVLAALAGTGMSALADNTALPLTVVMAFCGTSALTLHYWLVCRVAADSAGNPLTAPE